MIHFVLIIVHIFYVMDESRFCLDRHDRRICVWRRTGERYAQCCVIQGGRWGGASVSVWGGISED